MSWRRAWSAVLPYLVILGAIAFIGLCEGLTGGPTP